MRIHHLGIITKNIELSGKIYYDLGYTIEIKKTYDPVQGNNIMFLISEDCTQRIELIEPVNETSSIYNFDEGYHHICYEIERDDDIFELFKVQKLGKIFTKSISAPLLQDRKVVFAFLKNNTFVEFILL